MQKPVKRFLSGMTAVMLAFSCFASRPVSSYAADPDYKSWRQSDSRWGDTPMGYGGATVSGVGCLATSIAILAVHCGAVTSDSFNPGTFVNTMNDLGGFDGYGNLTNWNLISKAVPGLECEGKYSLPYGTSEYEYIEKLRELDEQGYYSICYIGHHWVLVDYIEGNTIYMCDPGSDSTNMLSTYPFNSYTHDTIRYFKYSDPQKTDNNSEYSEGIYEITASSLNIRKNPDTSSEVLYTIPNGERITVTEISNGWGRTSFNGYDGWISMEYTKFITSETVTTTSETTTTTTTTTATTTALTTTSENPAYSEGIYKINASALNLRENPDANSKSLTTIPDDEEIVITEFSNGWGKTSFNGYEGWVSMEYTEYVAPADTVTTTTTTTTTTMTTTTTAVTTDLPDESTVVTTLTASSMDTFTKPEADEYIIISETADITDISGENLLCTVPANAVVKVKSVNNESAEILFGDSTALISLKDIAPVSDTDTFPQKGDINNDGIIDKLDISAMNEYMLAEKELPDKISIFTSQSRYAADCNNDGIVDNNDVLQLLIEICSH